MSNKRRGIDVERKVKKELERRGFYVIKSSGSHGLFDLVAFDKKRIRLIQCKRSKDVNTSYSKDKKLIEEFRNHPGNTQKELWIWFDRQGFTVLRID